MARPATGSAHHQPKAAFRASPPRTMPERYAHTRVCRVSASKALLWRLAATLRLAPTRIGMTISDNPVMMMPAVDTEGGRSEERRVGKECRAGGGGWQYKK